jgi:hypothetical protein
MYTDLLHRYDFECLQDDSKLLLILLWLFASRCDNQIPADPKYLKKHLPFNGEIKLQVLVDAEFITCDSMLIASCAQNAIPEIETYKEEREKDILKISSKNHISKPPPRDTTEQTQAYNLLLHTGVDLIVADRLAVKWRVPLESIEAAVANSEVKAAQDRTRDHNPAGYVVQSITEARNNGELVKLSKAAQKLKNSS